MKIFTTNNGQRVLMEISANTQMESANNIQWNCVILGRFATQKCNQVHVRIRSAHAHANARRLAKYTHTHFRRRECLWEVNNWFLYKHTGTYTHTHAATWRSRFGNVHPAC